MIPYRMSEAGTCPRALVAARMGYEPIPDTEAGLRVMREGQRHEILVAEDLRVMGFELEGWGACSICGEENGGWRMGHHVEIQLPVLTLVGHIDRMVILDGKRYPVEIKSMGRFPFEKWKREGFGTFPGYAAQEVCYLEAHQSPGIYVVKNRDNGELLLYKISYSGQDLPPAPSPLTPLHLPALFSEVANILQWADLCARDRELPKCTVPEDERRWCKFRYLCEEGAKEEVVSEVHHADLVEAARLYREADSLKKVAEETIEHSKSVFLSHARTTPKFTVAGVRVSYSGMQTRKYLDRKKLEELVTEDVVEKAMSESKPYPGLRVTVLEEQ